MPYSTSIKKVEKEIKEMAKKISGLCGDVRRSVGQWLQFASSIKKVTDF